MGWFGKSKKKTSKAPVTPDSFGQKHLESAPQSIGQDSANEVFKVNYKGKHAFGDGETSGYFKPDGDMAPAKNAVAASRLASGMGWGDLIPETRYGTHDVTSHTGEKKKKLTGAVSKAATGEATMSPVFDTLNTVYTGSGNDTTKVKNGQAFDLSGFEMNDLDMSRPETQKQLNQLQWFDALIGNQDRHGANILIDPATGKVTGIDNDLAFGRGEKTTDWQGKDASDTYKSGRTTKFLGLPSQIDEETANKLLGLDNDTVASLINPEGGPGEKLSDEELQQVYDRLALIQSEVQAKVDSGSLVDAWDDTTYQDALSEQTGQNHWGDEISRSYVQRHAKSMEKASDTSNPDWWVKGRRTETTTPAPAAVLAPTPTPSPIWKPGRTWTQGTKPGAGPKMSLGGSRSRSQPPQKPLPPIPTSGDGGGGGTATVTKPVVDKPIKSRLVGTPWEGQ